MTIDPAEGHRLSGGEQSADDAVLSASEMRLRRLAALENPTTTSQASSAPPKYGVSPAAPSLLVDEDEDMQAAIAMSLHNTSGEEEEEEATMSNGGGAQPPSDTNGPPEEEPFDVSTFHSVMWDDDTTTDNDKTRWIQQGIDLRDKMNVDFAAPPPASDSMLTLVGSNHGPWGLTQHHGGPCGVLAAVQAELLRLLLFGSRNPLEYPLEIPLETVSSPASKTVADSLVREALAMSIAMIIARATLMPCAVEEDSYNSISNNKCARIVLPSSSSASASDENEYTGLTWNHLYPADENETNLNVYSIPVPPVSKKRQKTNEETMSADWLIPTEMRVIKLANAISIFLLQPLPDETEAPLEYYRQAGGVLLLTMSLVASRGKDMILQDMDDNMCKFTSQFGHCSQELMNLLLTGQSVSNVFDNTLTPSGGLTLRGIQSRPVIGYLTQLEALRYCEVGGYYKSPRFPLWVVGSQSHFTVLFGEPTCLKESKSDVLLEKCRRAFKSIQGAEENGYIPTDSLKEVLNKLDIHIDDDAQYSVLQAMVEMGGAGIILWDDFWKVASRLLTGATLASVLEREESGGSTGSMPPLLLTNGELEASADTKPAAMSIGDYFKGPSAKGVSFAIQRGVDGEQVSVGLEPETDEEMARRLAQEWGADELNSSPAAVAATPAAAAARPPSPMEMDSALSADEQLARKLQAEDWESDVPVSSTASVDAVTDSPPPPLEGELRGEELVEDSKMPATDSKMPSAAVMRKLDFEQFGNSFRMYHYNGLRGGSLTPFRVTRLTAEEAVGASVPLTNTGGAGDNGMASGDLEDVLRTKWPSCSIDWLGKSSPSID